MIAIEYSKDRGQHYMAAIRDGSNITAPPGGWSANEMLACAGAMIAGVFSQGPQVDRALGRRVMDMPTETQEFKQEQLRADIHAALEFLQTVSFSVLDGDYDDRFENQFKLMLDAKDSGRHALKPISGFKEGWQG